MSAANPLYTAHLLTPGKVPPISRWTAEGRRDSHQPEALMQVHRLNRAARMVAAGALVMVALAAVAAPAGARPDIGPQNVTHNAAPAAPPVVRQNIVQPGSDGVGTLGLILIGVGAGASILGAGYLGARIATSRLRIS
jgi:hypothetical protein